LWRLARFFANCVISSFQRIGRSDASSGRCRGSDPVDGNSIIERFYCGFWANRKQSKPHGWVARRGHAASNVNSRAGHSGRKRTQRKTCRAASLVAFIVNLRPSNSGERLGIIVMARANRRGFFFLVRVQCERIVRLIRRMSVTESGLDGYRCVIKFLLVPPVETSTWYAPRAKTGRDDGYTPGQPHDSWQLRWSLVSDI